jgi:GNAT superfamily N-acetyltransferase
MAATSYGVVVLAVTIRTAVAGDLDSIRGVFRRASLSNAGDRDALLAHPDVLVWPDATAAGRTRVAVEAGGAIAGFASTAVVDGRLELEDLFVEPDRMRQQVARRLVADVLDAARAQGFAAVEVEANPHAMDFYRAVGFVPYARARTRFGPAERLRLSTGASP